MSRTVAIADSHGRLVCPSCLLADTAPRRMLGLLGRTGLPLDKGVLLRPAPAVHTWFMRFAIDAVFLDRDLTVVRVADRMRPWRMARCRSAYAVLELPAGAAERRGLAPGDRLEVIGASA